MMATSFVIDVSSLNRLEGERDDLVAVLVGGERDHGQLDLLAELELRRVVLGQPALDADHVSELHQTDAEGDEVLTRRAFVRCAGREALGRPRDEGAVPRQQHIRHLPGAAPWAALLDGEGGCPALAAGASDELRILDRPGGDLRRERYLLCRHLVDDNRKWHSRLERTNRPQRDLGSGGTPSVYLPISWIKYTIAVSMNPTARRILALVACGSVAAAVLRPGRAVGQPGDHHRAMGRPVGDRRSAVHRQQLIRVHRARRGKPGGAETVGLTACRGVSVDQCDDVAADDLGEGTISVVACRPVPGALAHE